MKHTDAVYVKLSQLTTIIYTSFSYDILNNKNPFSIFYIIGFIISIIGISLYSCDMPLSDLSPSINIVFIFLIIENMLNLENEEDLLLVKTASDTPLPVIGKLQATI